MEIILFSALLLSLVIPLLLLLRTRTSSNRRLPPGSLGFPVIGQSFSLLTALRTNTDHEWFEERIRKYGPISKLTLFGHPTVFLHGQAANKFIYTCDGNTLANKMPPSLSRILGKKIIVELNGEDHKRVRAAIVSFLRPEVLKTYVPKMDQETRNHLDVHWRGKREVQVMPVMKVLTFNVICSLVLGLEEGTIRDKLLSLFQEMTRGLLSVPINVPFTQFNRSLNASSRLKTIIMDLIRAKRSILEEQKASGHQDLITHLINAQNENPNLTSDDEIVDNVVGLMFGGYDATSSLIKQDGIVRNKAPGESLTWDDLTNMKYSWRVATEVLRLNPPFFGSFRKAIKDIEYNGYIIPKGWQVMWVSSMTHMDGNIFSDPSRFDPTRFEQQTTKPPYSFVAFGGGVRVCPGGEFAKMETLTMIHYLVTRFTWKLSLKENSFGRDPMPVFNQGLPVLVSPRKHYHSMT
ncbi:cytochrome P450 [Cynara cardunculus var. scolymus]|uniref:Cytochrome P450 n=1 Tax=Cynara cardunculus var. scolymus TaxID=59895 RepID=A0A118K0S6_CYNCS|nr:cytochrome P450 [Cynara cardunculus var. scolymus]